MLAGGRVAALTVPPALGRCDKPQCVGPWCAGASLRHFSLLVCEHFGEGHVIPHWGLVETWRSTGQYNCALQSPLSHTHLFAVYPGFMGWLSLLNEDRVGLHPCGRMSLWPKSRKMLGWEEWSAFLAFILSWLPAKLDFWSQAQAQVELE